MSNLTKYLAKFRDFRGASVTGGGDSRAPSVRNPVYTCACADGSLLDHSAEISEIDARLNALQQFMKRSLEITRAAQSKR